MDPVTAFTLVAGVIGIVDFTSKLLLDAKELLESADDALPRNALIERLAKRSDELAEGVAKLSEDNSGKDNALCDLSKRCRDEAQVLITLLDPLKVEIRPDGTKSKRKALCTVIKTVIKRRKVEMSRERLENLNGQLADHLIFRISQSQSEGFKELQDLVKGKNDDSVQSLLKVKDGVHDRLTVMQKDLRHVETLLLDGQEKRWAKIIIDSLAFPEMDQRRQAVEDNHKNTFRWMFSDPNTSYTRWLSAGNGIFWVSGEAGSGKSTLMKYLHSEPRTNELLTAWAGDGQLITADFYYWVAGSSMQRSPQGMLQSILYQILAARPGLVPVILQEDWNAVANGGLQVRWTHEKLLDTLLTTSQRESLKVCVFIDGLDECDGNRQQQCLRDLIALANCERIKFCVSSRPWPVFEDAFGTSGNKVVVQDLTMHDIFDTVRDRLTEADPGHFGGEVCGNEIFIDRTTGQMYLPRETAHMLSEEQREARKLVLRVMNKAQGVFLWTSIVLGNLCERLLSGHKPSQLSEYVAGLPADLETYLRQYIYARIHNTYKEGRFPDTAMALKLASVGMQLMGEDMNPLYSTDSAFATSFFHFWLLRNSTAGGVGILNADFGAEQDCMDYSREQLELMIGDTRRYLAGCCKDMLQVRVDSQGNHDSDVVVKHAGVSFRHRMIYDFVVTKEMQSKIDAKVPRHFLSDDFAHQMGLVYMKVLPFDFDQDISHYTVDDGRVATGSEQRFISSALAAATTTGRLEPSELEEVMIAHFHRRGADFSIPYTRSLHGYLEEELYIVLARLVSHGRLTYVTEVFTRTPAMVCQVRGMALVWRSALSLADEDVKVNIIELMLRFGACPNSSQLSNSLSPWHAVLRGLWFNRNQPCEGCTKAISRVCAACFTKTRLVRSMIEHGADVQLEIRTDVGRFEDDYFADLSFVEGNQEDKLPDISVLEVCKAVLPENHIPAMSAMLEDYARAERQEEMREARRRRIRNYSDWWLERNDFLLLDRPVPEGR